MDDVQFYVCWGGRIYAAFRLPPTLWAAWDLRPESQTPPATSAAKRLEKNGQIIRTKGNRYIQAREADLVPGIIRVNRQGKGFLDPDDSAL